MATTVLEVRSTFLNRPINKSVAIDEEIVEVVRDTIAAAATDQLVPVSIPDMTKVKAIVLVTNRPVTFKVDVAVTVYPLGDLIVLSGKSVLILAGSTIAVLKFTNADVDNAASLEIGIVRSST